MTSPVSREQVELAILTVQVDEPTPEQNEAIQALWHTDAALRAQLDTSMRRQETLANNVNDGLLEIRGLRARVAELEQQSQRYDRELAKAIEIDEATNAERGTALNEANNRITELEQALRLHLAVSPDDPLLVEPVEQQIVILQQQLATVTRCCDDNYLMYTNMEHQRSELEHQLQARDREIERLKDGK